MLASDSLVVEEGQEEDEEGRWEEPVKLILLSFDFTFLTDHPGHGVLQFTSVLPVGRKEKWKEM